MSGLDRPTLRTVAAFSALVTCSFAAAAEDKRPTTPVASLPGVEGGYSIVKPAPEPDRTEATEDGTIRAGNWEITVSGYVWVQVGAGSARPAAPGAKP